MCVSVVVVSQCDCVRGAERRSSARAAVAATCPPVVCHTLARFSVGLDVPLREHLKLSSSSSVVFVAALWIIVANCDELF